MRATKYTALTAVTICALALATLGSAKHPAARPLKGIGHVTVTINLNNGSGVWQDWGQATHSGLFTSEASTTDGGAIWSGAVTAANGDKIFWVMPGSSWPVQFTGGTGRFEGASGGMNPVNSGAVVTYPDANTMVMTFTYTAEGTVSY